jgi:hypothetical protein
MQVLEVGKPYLPVLASLPEGDQYHFRGGRHELLLWLKNPSRDEIESVRTGEAEFALFVHRSAIFLLYRFGDAVDWSDAPYSSHLVPPEQRELPQPPATPETRTLLQIILVDAGKNVVRVIRAVTLSPEFSRTLADTITKQAREPWIEKTYSVDVADAYVCCPTTGDMVAAAIVRSKGGE